MSAAAQTMLREYAAVTWPTMNHKGRIAMLARKLGFGHRRVRSLYQAEPGARVRADEMAALEALQLQEARDDFRALQARIARLEAALSITDEAFNSDQVEGLRQSVAIGRGENGSRDSGADR